MAYIKAISTFIPPSDNILTNSQLKEEFPNVDIDKIANAVKDQLNPLYKALGVEKTK